MKYKIYKKLIIGSANFAKNYKTNSQHKILSINIIKDILKYALKKKITQIDTAVGYKNSEKLIGNFLKKNKKKNDWKIITKIKLNKQKNIKKIIFNIVKRLKQEPYAILAHDLKTYKNKEFQSTLDEFPLIKRGISVYEKNETLKAINYRVPDIIQFPINLLDKRFEKNKFLKVLKNKNIETHARSIFLKGMLHHNNVIKSKKNSNLLKFINKLSEKLKKFKLSLNEISLINVYNNKYIDKIIIGVDDVNQLKNNLMTIKNNIKNRKISNIKIVNKLKFNHIDPRKL